MNEDTGRLRGEEEEERGGKEGVWGKRKGGGKGGDVGKGKKKTFCKKSLLKDLFESHRGRKLRKKKEQKYRSRPAEGKLLPSIRAHAELPLSNCRS